MCVSVCVFSRQAIVPVPPPPTPPVWVTVDAGADAEAVAAADLAQAQQRVEYTAACAAATAAHHERLQLAATDSRTQADALLAFWAAPVQTPAVADAMLPPVTLPSWTRLLPVVSTDGTEAIVARQVHAAVAPVFDVLARQTLLGLAPLAADVAAAALRGPRTLSGWGRRCPVCCQANADVDPPRMVAASSLAFAITFGPTLVLCACSDAHRQQLLEQPAAFTVAAPRPVLAAAWAAQAQLTQAVHVLVVGPPGSGQTTLARRIASQCGLVYLSLPLILQWVMAGVVPTQDGTIGFDSAVGQQLAHTLRSGGAVDAALWARAVALVTASAVCVRQGWVLDGWPRTASDAAVLLHRAGVRVHQVLVLPTPTPTPAPAPASAESAITDASIAAAAATASWEAHVLDITRILARPHTSVVHLPHTGAASVWSAASTALAAVRRQRWEYATRTAAGQAAAAAPGTLVLAPATLRARWGACDYYCPVCWHRRHQLVRCPAHLDGTVEFHRRLYRCCSLPCRDAFMAAPAIFLTTPVPSAGERPFQLAPRDAERLCLEHVELQGYCPVTLRQALDIGTRRVRRGAFFSLFFLLLLLWLAFFHPVTRLRCLCVCVCACVQALPAPSSWSRATSAAAPSGAAASSSCTRNTNGSSSCSSLRATRGCGCPRNWSWLLGRASPPMHCWQQATGLGIWNRPWHPRPSMP